MITTIYKCDRCGKEQYTPEQMWEVGVVYKHIHYASSSSEKYPYQTKLWCRACVETLGILPIKEGAPDETQPPTFEDLIREIVRDEQTSQ